MAQFPSVDPIPLPAPVWLFKLLHLLTFALHMTAVQLLVGGLICSLLFHLAGRYFRHDAAAQSAGMMMHRLPTVMAYVINLGVPPLLFAQVLYGRALYTSSVLIGAYWISVIFLLIASYFGIYVAAKRAEARKGWMAVGLASLVLALSIAFIYSNNMTLMIRPSEWAAMYKNNPSGTQLNAGDPTVFPRWAFFMLGTLPATGCAMLLLALKASLTDETRKFLRSTGGFVTALAVAAQSAAALWVVNVQPAGIWDKMLGDGFYQPFVWAALLTAVLLLVAALAAAFLPTARMALAAGAATLAFLNTGAVVVVRDGIRDYTLRAAGMEVWARTVVTNWSVVVLFLILFVAALGVLAFLAYVVAKAKPLEEKYV
jgi:hypothetical protein